jgi:hypothetical protein
VATGNLGDLSHKALPIGADQTGDVAAISGDPSFDEDAHPRLDPGLDRVDEGAIEIEDDRARVG